MSYENVTVTEPTSEPITTTSNFTNLLENHSYDSDINDSKMSRAVSFLGNLSVWFYVLIILILAFLGFNIFNTLGDLTETLNRVFRPIFILVSTFITNIIKHTTHITAGGIKYGADATTNTVDAAVDVMENSIENNKVKFNRIDGNEKTFVNGAEKKIHALPEADDASSLTQRNQKNKPSYCYIGEDRGFRSCIRVEDADTCMSGNIFPTEELCLNPALRE